MTPYKVLVGTRTKINFPDVYYFRYKKDAQRFAKANKTFIIKVNKEAKR